MEIRRTKVYRTIALLISLLIHIALVFYLFGWDLMSSVTDSTIALVDSK